MAKYWIYVNNQVLGPYELEQLIRVPGFSRQSMVSRDDGGAGQWISPAEIPELARIFQKVEELHDAPVPAPRPAPKPKPRMPAKLTPVAPPAEAPQRGFWKSWMWLIPLAAASAGGTYYWIQQAERKAHLEERVTARTLVETAPLPSTSLYSSLRQYFHTQDISPRWEFERASTGLYNVTASWVSPDNAGKRLPVYAFEVNLQVESVRGVNSAAIKLLAEGFPKPVVKASAPAPPPKKSPGDLFPGAINDRRAAFEQGDFEAVWDLFSARRKSDMSQGGITRDGFIRMQKLTYRPNSGLKQDIVKTKTESDTERLVLLRQSQPKHPDIYVKQRWLWEDSAWRLDEEEKKAATAVLPTPPAAEPGPQTPPPSPPSSSKPAPTGFAPQIPNLPGLSDR
jgi:hypothetical protein